MYFLRKFIVLVVILIISHFNTFPQKSIDSSITFPMFTVSVMVQFPGGAIKDNFGINTNIGGSFMLKFRNRFFVDFNANYIFGGILKGEYAQIFDSIKTGTGAILNQNGEFSKIRTYERGYFAGIRAGRIFNIINSNPNSGPLVLIGGGILQHKIRIENDGNNAPQILGDYKKGYDKMRYGLCLSQFIGYIYISKNQLMNFYAGIELYQAYTKSGRTYDYSLMKYNEGSQTDLLWSLKMGWIIPVYKRTPEKFYYN